MNESNPFGLSPYLCEVDNLPACCSILAKISSKNNPLSNISLCLYKGFILTALPFISSDRLLSLLCRYSGGLLCDLLTADFFFWCKSLSNRLARFANFLSNFQELCADPIVLVYAFSMKNPKLNLVMLNLQTGTTWHLYVSSSHLDFHFQKSIFFQHLERFPCQISESSIVKLNSCAGPETILKMAHSITDILRTDFATKFLKSSVVI